MDRKSFCQQINLWLSQVVDSLITCILISISLRVRMDFCYKIGIIFSLPITELNCVSRSIAWRKI